MNRHTTFKYNEPLNPERFERNMLIIMHRENFYLNAWKSIPDFAMDISEHNGRLIINLILFI